MVAVVSSSLSGAGSWAAISAASLAFAGILFAFIRWLVRRCKLQHVDIRFLVPKNKYPCASFNGAPADERKPSQLTVGIGTYRLMHVIEPKTDMLIDPLVLRFEGKSDDMPERYGTDNPFIVEKLDDGSCRDWWGDIQPPPENWPRYIHHGDTVVIGNRIRTRGQWVGKVHFEVRVRNGPIIYKRLGFTVSLNSEDDEIPFLKVDDSQRLIRTDSPTNIGKSTIIT